MSKTPSQYSDPSLHGPPSYGSSSHISPLHIPSSHIPSPRSSTSHPSQPSLSPQRSSSYNSSRNPPPRSSSSHEPILPQSAPSPSIWTRLVQWVPDFSFTGAAGVAVPVDDLRPRAKHVQITLDAVDDIRFCETLFIGWMAELNKVTSDSEHQDRREEHLRYCLGRLKSNAWTYSTATNAILEYHAQFAFLMAQRINDASESQSNMKCDDSETKRLAKDISNASRLLSTAVIEMKEGIDLFVSALQNVQLAMKHEPPLAERILRWLKSLFKVIVSILDIANHPISAVHPSAEPRRQRPAVIVSTLREAAAKFCTADLEHPEGKESESLDSVILFLRQIVPNEAEITQKKLERFDEALYMKQLESYMRAGRRVTLQGPDPAAVAKEWRDVAKRYKSALEQNKSHQ